MQAGRISKGEKLVPVDHSTITYPPFRKVRPSALNPGGIVWTDIRKIVPKIVPKDSTPLPEGPLPRLFPRCTALVLRKQPPFQQYTIAAPKNAPLARVGSAGVHAWGCRSDTMFAAVQYLVLLR